MSESTRRQFVTSLGAAAVAGAGVSGASAMADDKPQGPAPMARGEKRVIAGNPSSVFSRAVVHGGVIYVSGVLGTRPESRELAGKDFAAQARQAMENLKASVEAAGSDMRRVLKCQCFLTEQSDFASFNEIYGPFFPEDRPARSTVIVKDLVLAGAKIEIDCIAY